MHPSFVCRTRRPTLNLRPNILIPNKTPKALSKCPCKMHLQKTRFDRSLQLCSRWVVEYLGQYLQQVGGGIFVAIFVAGGWMNIGDNICNRWVVEYLGQYLQQVGRGIFWTIFTAGEWWNIWRNFCRLVGEYFGEYFQQVGGDWRTCCRWRPLHNWLQPCDRPSSNHSSVCTVRTPQNQARYTYLQNIFKKLITLQNILKNLLTPQAD